MKVTVVDWNFKFIEEFDGQYLNGVLIHSRGQHKIGPIKFGGTIEEMEFDYHKTIDKGKYREALYQWDGKNLHQLSFHDVPESSTLVDYKNSWEISKLTEETALKPPEDKMRNIATTLWAIAVLLSAIALVYTTNHVVTVYNNLAHDTPVYNISIQNGEILNYLAKEMNMSSLQNTATLNYLENMSRYLNTHG